MIHLTEKPVELAQRAMEYSSKRGENVLGLFGGLGSTLSRPSATKLTDSPQVRHRPQTRLAGTRTCR
jgi:hypothetical protein